PPSPVRGISESAVSALLSNRPVSLREAEVRRSNARRLMTVISQARDQGISRPPNSEPGYLRLPVRAPGGFADLGDPDRATHLGLAPSYPVPLSDLEVLRPHVARATPTPGSAELARTLFTAPTHSMLSEGDLIAIEEL